MSDRAVEALGERLLAMVCATFWRGIAVAGRAIQLYNRVRIEVVSCLPLTTTFPYVLCFSVHIGSTEVSLHHQKLKP